MPDNFIKRTKKQLKLAWSTEDKQFLKDNYHLMSFDELAEHFGKDVKQIKNQAQRQYLSKRGK